MSEKKLILVIVAISLFRCFDSVVIVDNVVVVLVAVDFNDVPVK